MDEREHSGRISDLLDDFDDFIRRQPIPMAEPVRKSRGLFRGSGERE